MDIEYWEIWNEPDLDSDDSTHKRCWGGTKAQFFELYDIAANHLKNCFPHLKIGGPALAWDLEWADEFLAQLKAPLDFFSWHLYADEPWKLAKRAEQVRAMLDKHGFEKTESILNEWNYVRGWVGDDWLYSLRAEKSLKGAALIASAMSACQYSNVDMLMYYDARPCGMNGMFCTDFVCDCLKGYYPFPMFNTLYKLGTAVPVECGEKLYGCAARGDGKAAVMLTHYCDDDATGPKDVRVEMRGFTGQNGVRARFLLLDAGHDMELVREEIFSGEQFATFLTLENLSTVLIELEAI